MDLKIFRSPARRASWSYGSSRLCWTLYVPGDRATPAPRGAKLPMQCAFVIYRVTLSRHVMIDTAGFSIK